MGVHGLWQLLEPAGRPVECSTLKGKVLAIDASIWLHQLIKGFRDKDGNPLPNAHLLGIFYRICKLLSYGIKPVFVFDGGVPSLKRQTIAARKQRRIGALDKSEESRQKLLSNYLRQHVQKLTKKNLTESEQESLVTSPTKRNLSPSKRNKFQELDEQLETFRNRFKLATSPDVDRVGVSYEIDQNSDSSDHESPSFSNSSSFNSHKYHYGMDYAENFSTITSEDFSSLPLDTQHEILFEMQESRKMNSWGKMEKMPKQLKDFSDFQMDRLVKRQFLQRKIRSVQKEMGQRHMQVQDLDELLKMDYNLDDEVSGSQDKGYLLVKKAPATSTSKISEEEQKVLHSTTDGSKLPISNVERITGRDEEDQQLAQAIALSLDSTSECLGTDMVSQSSHEFNSNLDVENCEASEISSEITSKLQEEEDRQLARAISISLEESTRTCTSTTSFNPSPGKVDGNRDLEKEIGLSSNKQSSYLDNSDESQSMESFQVIDKEVATNSVFEGSSEKLWYNCGHTADTVPSNRHKTTPSINDNGNDKIAADTSSDSDFEEVPEMENDSEHNPENSSPVSGLIIDVKDVMSAPAKDLFSDIFSEGCKTTEPSEPVIIIDNEPESFSSTENTSALKNQENETFAKTDDPSDNEEKFISDNSGKKLITLEYLQSQDRLNTEVNKLKSVQAQNERIGSSISDQINVETQELLGLFGIPYVVSPMEAESQCAFLDKACLVDGCITDDSDVWLFGGLRVFKNFYSWGNKPVEFYQSADIFRILSLTREKLVLIAMLIGGDYNIGIEGVGPITALEIIGEFGTSNVGFGTLVSFRDWWESVNSPDFKDLKLTKERKKFKSLKLSSGFPSKEVYEAYMNPTIDPSLDKFRWGKVDIDSIRRYAESKFGWESSKCDSMLKPVLKSLDCDHGDNMQQLTLDKFIPIKSMVLANPYKKKKGSKRLHSAVKKLKQNSSSELALSSESSESESETSKHLYTKRQKVGNLSEETFQQSHDELSNPGECSSSAVNTLVEVPSQPSTSQPVIPVSVVKKKKESIPQKIQEETTKRLNKEKAIKLFKGKLSKTNHN